MKTILVACETKEGALRGLRAAADLSVACGSRLAFAYAPEGAASDEGMAALGRLSDVLFARERWGMAPGFGAAAGAGTPAWVGETIERVDESWKVLDVRELIGRVRSEAPDLAVAGDRRLARVLVSETPVPVWYVGKRAAEQYWFAMRKLRCAVHGSRPAEWARALAASMGAEFEIAEAWARNADVRVVSRESLAGWVHPLVGSAAHPLVVV